MNTEQFQVKVTVKDEAIAAKVREVVTVNFSLYRNNPQYCFGIQAVPDGLEKFHLLYGDSKQWVDLFTKSVKEFVKEHYKIKLKSAVKDGIITFSDMTIKE